MNHPFLNAGLTELSINTASEPFMHYLTLLEKWNRTYNLTAIKDIDSMVTRHLLDSLAISPWIKGNRLIDVGAGAGLPGIPLAIAHPELQVVLLDSNGKKVRFMQEVKRALRLENIEIVQSRVENYQPSSGFDTVTSRAFSTLELMISWTKHLVVNRGIWLAMKGRYPQSELDLVNLPFHVKNYTVPGLDGDRCCVIIDNVTEE